MIRREGIHLVLMQDSAPGHAAGDTKQDLAERGIIVIFWPPFSPDLNPIETLWDLMKDYLQERSSEVPRSYKRLREAVQEAWESITQYNEASRSVDEIGNQD